MSAPLLPARPCPLASLPAPLPRGSCTEPRGGPPDLRGPLSGTRRAPAGATVPRYLARPGMGGVRQRAHPGSSARPHLLSPLCPPHRHLQPPSRGPGGRPGDLSLQGLPARPPLAHHDTGSRRILAAADAPCPAAWFPQAAALRLLGESCAPGETRAVPRAPGARPSTPCPASDYGPQAARGVSVGARGRMSGLPARAHATGADPVSPVGSVGPVCAHPWIGHLIEEAGEAGSEHVPDSRLVQPGGAWCVHPRRTTS